MSLWPRLGLLGAILLLVSLPSFAGSQVREQAILPLDDIAVLSKEVERLAAAQGARVFLMARVGIPVNELPEGVEYTHVSFAVYSSIKTEDGRSIPGYVVYNLYQDAEQPDRSKLVMDFPMDFLAGAQVPKVGIIIPRRDLQKRLYDVIQSRTYQGLHNPSYSVIANPYNTKYQNCTEHMLDVINAAIYQTDDIEQIKDAAQQYFQSRQLKIGPFRLLLGSLFKSDIKTSDHKGPIRIATFGTIAGYLNAYGLVDRVTDVEL